MILVVTVALTANGSPFLTGLVLVMVAVILWLAFTLSRLTEQAFHFKEQKRMRKEQLRKQQEEEQKRQG